MVWRKLFSGKRREVESNEKPQETGQHPEPSIGEENKGPSTSGGFFQQLRQGLTKTRESFVGRVEQIITGRRIDEDLFEELEEVLIQADVGLPTTLALMERIRDRVRSERLTEGHQVKRVLREEIEALLAMDEQTLVVPAENPAVIMIVGVNGAGKTTTIGKLAHRLKDEKASVLLAAGDTFRAAAVEQLKVWADRIGVDVVAHEEGADPAAVAFDAVQAAKARQYDVLIVDTAGRLQTKKNLMAELNKVYRVIAREIGRDVDEVLLVVDATTGQNALSQARLFKEAVPVSGIVLTKLDGTAKGGIVLALANELKIPVKLIGVGEKYTDLQDFDPAAFSSALFGSDSNN